MVRETIVADSRAHFRYNKIQVLAETWMTQTKRDVSHSLSLLMSSRIHYSLESGAHHKQNVKINDILKFLIYPLLHSFD